MPTPDQVRTAVQRHFDCWNAGRRDDWITNFADDVVFHDPVGAPPKHGRKAAEASWDNSLSGDQQWTLELTRLVVCGDEAAITLLNRGRVDGRQFSMEGIEIWRVDDGGLVSQVRAYFEPPEDVVLNEYFRHDRTPDPK